ncbi:MAG: hypothetical protein KAT65_09820, partial [Methanophagales archaeon]|nr:hypothetical protein [Methanophagales archaeon]
IAVNIVCIPIAASTIAITAFSISVGEPNPMPIYVSTTFIPIAISINNNVVPIMSSFSSEW